MADGSDGVRHARRRDCALPLSSRGRPNPASSAGSDEPVLNIGYHLHSRRVVGLAIVAVTVAANVGLFAGSLVFLASGQTFEQFSGIE